MDARRTAGRLVAMQEEGSEAVAEVSDHAIDDRGWWGLAPHMIWEGAA